MENEKLRILERALAELTRDVISLKHSVWALEGTLVALSPKPAEAEALLEIAAKAAPELDADKSLNERLEAYIEILKAGKNPRKPDS